MEVLSVERSLTEADRNCVVATRGGEQRKANDRSVRKELDSVFRWDEPASEWRSLDVMDADGKRSCTRASKLKNVRKLSVNVGGWLETERSEHPSE